MKGVKRFFMKDNRPQIMGILNVTPDSFYDGGKFTDFSAAHAHALEMIKEGADIIDVGGESTRPGADPVFEDVEISRTVPVIEKLSSSTETMLSIDTSKAAVAEAALRAGAGMVNDISGLTFDEKMADTVAKFDASVVIMHIQGTPRTMQLAPRYDDLMGEIISFFEERSAYAVDAGIKKEKIILDPGIGFGKTLDDNYRIINNIHRIKELGYPVLIGLSRKSLIGKLIGEEDRLPATIALNAVAIQQGADIIRVHDVREHALIVESLLKLKKVS